MSVHNPEHNSLINSDQDDDVHDPVTRISKLDISDLLHLHSNDTTALTVVSIKLKGTKNYQVWSCAMLVALKGKNKIGFIDGSYKRSNINEVLGKQWDKYDAMIELPKCVCTASKGFKKHNQLLKLMQFLMGLDDSYMQIRSSILSRETLHDVRSAYAFIYSEESDILLMNIRPGPLRPNNTNNNRQGGGCGLINNREGGGSGLVCENCEFNGHTVDRCFKIIGYPADFEKKKSGQNFKKHNVFNNNSVGKVHLLDLLMNKWPLLSLSSKTIKLEKIYHPNGTEAYISKIVNLRLSNGLTLYDVMVIPEYCVTLIFVH
nr:ribonuclease H-like domain-containing protein [Tanacetum cinerariifolium]